MGELGDRESQRATVSRKRFFAKAAKKLAENLAALPKPGNQRGTKLISVPGAKRFDRVRMAPQEAVRRRKNAAAESAYTD